MLLHESRNHKIYRICIRIVATNEILVRSGSGRLLIRYYCSPHNKKFMNVVLQNSAKNSNDGKNFNLRNDKMQILTS
jgi:hypothetical protein